MHQSSFGHELIFFFVKAPKWANGEQGSAQAEAAGNFGQLPHVDSVEQAGKVLTQGFSLHVP